MSPQYGDNQDPPDDTCKRCRCCSEMWEECTQCGGEGWDGHDCGEDCCCCLHPEQNVVCDTCNGHGGWHLCAGACDKDGKHKKRRGDA
jgi:hypothetical protein